ncbi:MAG: hypothetical protein GVY10_08330 [Verrucomicrobia bacterium]|nr:hypothetical protein [Verrucomicrobiota bacterium]
MRTLDQILAWSRPYRQWLERFPQLAEALQEELDPESGPFGPGRLRQSREWLSARLPDSPCFLQHFRRLHTLRIALRERRESAALPSLLREHSDLAEFCLATLLEEVREASRQQYGDPWLEEADRCAGLLVLALGKLGGRELNLFSDIDLIFVCEGKGYCRKNGRRTHCSNTAFYCRLVRTFCQRAQRRTEAGLLFHVDLRLRPEGESGPLVPTLESLLQYYYGRGQPWERMALLKARRVYGSREMEHEFTETIHSFRYPRFPPPNLSAEVAFLKERTEQEIVGRTAMREDIKNGWGGIREIEFLVQVLQLLHGSRLPFLQTPNTREALEQLRRYEILPPGEARALVAAWEILRRTENLLQLQEEKPVHRVPGGREDRERLAGLLGFVDGKAFLEELKSAREVVHSHYGELFPRKDKNPLQEEWMALFSGRPVSGNLQPRLASWFGEREKEGEAALRSLATDQPNRPVTREEISLFVHLTGAFADTLPRTADPVRTLQRIASFATAYGARKEFLRTCREYPHFFTLLALLFDRSTFIHQLLCRFPFIMEELLRRTGRRRKTVRDQLDDLAHGPEKEFPDWLWLFVKAEQVRIVGNQLLGFDSRSAMEAQLSDLAEAVCRECLRRLGIEEQMGVLAFGKFGGGELSPGSDLDLVLISPGPPTESLKEAVRTFLRLLGHDRTPGSTFAVDLRLRPHGSDGPLLTSFERLRTYYARKAQDWEVQALVRARIVAGPLSLRRQFSEFRHSLLFSPQAYRPPGKDFEDPAMRKPRLREKVGSRDPVRCFKHAPGGSVDIELFTLHLARHFGAFLPALRVPRVRQLLAFIAETPALSAFAPLQKTYARFREIELALRRDSFRDVHELPANAAERDSLARWLDCENADALSAEIRHLLGKTRQLLASPLPDPRFFPQNPPPTFTSEKGSLS